MIEHFNIPIGAQIRTPITKSMFVDKGGLSSVEKKLLREYVESFVMSGLIQTRTSGIDSYIDENYRYDQLVFAEVAVSNVDKAKAVAEMIQRHFPAPMILVVRVQECYCVNWCVKRVNQSDSTKRVIENMRQTRMFSIDSSDPLAVEWVKSLDVMALNGDTIKGVFDRLSERLMMLNVSDEVGELVSDSSLSTDQYSRLFEELKVNRDAQGVVSRKLKCESQFNVRMKLTVQLKELQEQEEMIKLKMR